ncbi:MAG TPA: hypothetical protein PKY56_10995 [Candidatus Kapabacteria bacterium]|nr:hypothetical protein [Candidatus Kapabacteria bacterium]HPO62079.1 hypothetical protein [Candidatus Kapabacteria bacterium]
MNLTIDEILDSVEKLDLIEQEMIIEIAQKRLNLKRRNEIISDVKQSRIDYKKGKVKSGTSKDFMRDLLK